MFEAKLWHKFLLNPCRRAAPHWSFLSGGGGRKEEVYLLMLKSSYYAIPPLVEEPFQAHQALKVLMMSATYTFSRPVNQKRAMDRSSSSGGKIID